MSEPEDQEALPRGCAYMCFYIFDESTLCEELVPLLNYLKLFTEPEIFRMYNYEQFRFHVQDKFRSNTRLYRICKEQLDFIDTSEGLKEEKISGIFQGVPIKDQVIFSVTVIQTYLENLKIDFNMVDSPLKDLLIHRTKLLTPASIKLTNMLRSKEAPRLCNEHRLEECYECVDRDSKAYQFNSYYDEKRDWMLCEITRAYEPVPFSTIIKRFKIKGYEPLFSNLYFSREWGNECDELFMKELWIHFFGNEEGYNVTKFQQKTLEFLDEEPLVFRKPMSSIIRIGELNLE